MQRRCRFADAHPIRSQTGRSRAAARTAGVRRRVERPLHRQLSRCRAAVGDYFAKNRRGAPRCLGRRAWRKTTGEGRMENGRRRDRHQSGSALSGTRETPQGVRLANRCALATSGKKRGVRRAGPRSDAFHVRAGHDLTPRKPVKASCTRKSPGVPRDTPNRPLAGPTRNSRDGEALRLRPRGDRPSPTPPDRSGWTPHPSVAARGTPDRLGATRPGAAPSPAGPPASCETWRPRPGRVTGAANFRSAIRRAPFPGKGFSPNRTTHPRRGGGHPEGAASFAPPSPSPFRAPAPALA